MTRSYITRSLANEINESKLQKIEKIQRMKNWKANVDLATKIECSVCSKGKNQEYVEYNMFNLLYIRRITI